MESFTRYIDGLNKKTLYVSRQLMNADVLIRWAKKHGCDTCLKPEAMHVTLCYSKDALLWPKPDCDVLTLRGVRGHVEKFDGGALVFQFHSPELEKRHFAIQAAGATSNYPEYKSHITLTYESDDLDPNNFPSCKGTLIFGPEVFKEIEEDNSSWKNQNLEEGDYWHKPVDAWGLITPDGVKSGNAEGKHYDSHDSMGNRGKTDAEYLREKGVLHIRTHDRGTLDSAIKHFESLPHGKRGEVIHEHHDHSKCKPHWDNLCRAPVTHSHVGKRYMVLSKMRKLAQA